MKIRLSALLLTLLAAVPLYAAGAPLSARLGEVTGEVSTRASGAAPWVTVKNGAMIAPGSEVRTAKGASAVIAFSDNNKVKLHSATIFGLDRATTKKTELRLFSGKIQAWVKRLNKADFTVRHAAGVAAVRGTILGVEGTEADATFTLYEGAMDIIDAFGKSLSLSPGQTANLTEAGGNKGTSTTPAGPPPEEPTVEAPPPPPEPTTTQTEGETAPPEEIAAEDIPAEGTEPMPYSPTQEAATTVSPSAP